MKKPKSYQALPISRVAVRLGDIATMPIQMTPGAALQLLYTYYPKTVESLLERALKSAQRDHFLTLQKDYSAQFGPTHD